MTKIQVRFHLLKPLDETAMARLSDANSIYGIDRIQAEPSLEDILVEYDASRLKLREVERVLEGFGIAVAPK